MFRITDLCLKAFNMSDVEDTEEKKRVHVTSSDSDQATKDEPMKARLRAKRAKASNIHSSSSEEDNSDDDKVQ